MRYKEWILLLLISGLGIALANYVGFKVDFLTSLPGILVLLGISFCAIVLDRIIPIKLPVIAYCSLLGLFLACPLSPIAGFVISSVGKINFTAPLTMVGAYAGMSISNQLKAFVKQGWKMIIVAILVMTGTYTCSLLIAQAALKATHVI